MSVQVLGECLGRIKSQKDILTAITIYEKIRKPRSDKVIAGTFSQKDCIHAHDGPYQVRRDATFKAQGRIEDRTNEYPSLHLNPEFWKFICDYDPYGEVARYWDLHCDDLQ